MFAIAPVSVRKLVTLATPHHGSPLVLSLAGVYALLQAALNPQPGAPIAIGRDLVELLTSHPALIDLMPSSPFMRELNRGTASPWAPDWSGLCGWPAPPPEVRLNGSTRYFAIAGDPGQSWLGPYLLTATLLAAPPWNCLENDGAVPLVSAQLSSTAPNVENLIIPNVHHKRSASLGVVEDPNVWDVVKALLTDDDRAMATAAIDPAASVDVASWRSLDAGVLSLTPGVEAVATISSAAADTLRFSYLFRSGSTSAFLRTPTGQVVDEAVADVDPLITCETDPESGLMSYLVAAPEAGAWQVCARDDHATVDYGIVYLVDGVNAVAMNAMLGFRCRWHGE